MQIQRGHFDPSDVKLYGAGAGVIPMCIGEGGEPMLLLGRERFLPQWKGSCRWSGWEGSRKDAETLEQTAVREFNEESLGVVLPAHEMTERIQNGEYWIRVVLRIMNDKKVERYHTTYVFLMPYDPRIAERFLHLRDRVERIERLADDFERLFPTFAYKSDILMEIGDVDVDDEWVVLHRAPVEDACNLCPECQLARDTWSELDEEVAVQDVEDAIADVEKEAVSTVCTHAGEDEGEEVEGVLDLFRCRLSWTAGEEGRQTMTFPAEHPYAVRLKAWKEVRAKLEQSLIVHECVHVCRGPLSGHIQHVSVCTDFLEKDQMRWWPVSDLRRVMDMRGYLGHECFRPYFLPVMQTILHEVSNVQRAALAKKSSTAATSRRLPTTRRRENEPLSSRPSFASVVSRNL